VPHCLALKTEGRKGVWGKKNLVRSRRATKGENQLKIIFFEKRLPIKTEDA